MNVDGWITIGTKLDNSEFDNQYRKLLGKLKEKKEEGEKLAKIKVKIETDLQSYEQEKKMIEEFTNEKLTYAMSDAEAREVLTAEERQLKDLDMEYSTQFEKLEEINGQINENVNSQELLKQQIEETNLKLENTKHFVDIKKSINDVGKSIKRVTKQVIHWGLAIFGIRSAYLFVRQAMSTLSGYNEQLATDLQYIRFALASTLQPVIEYIIKLVITLLQYLGYIVKQLFGINIFKNSGVDKFQKSMASSADSAKEIKNQLAGFDEMNVLQDNSGGDTDNAGGVAPSVDFSKLENGKVPKWLETVVKVGKWILDNWEDVVFTLLLVKLFIDLLTGNWIGVIIDLIGLLIIAFKKIWENLKEIIDIIKPYFKQFVDWISKNIIEPISKFFKNLWNGISDGVKGAVNNIKKFFNSIPSFFSGIVEKIKTFFRNIGTSAGNVIASTFKAVVNGILRTIENVLNTPIRTINSLISIINKISPTKIGKLSTFNLPRLAKGGIINMPGRGVPIGSAIAGERGAEGVIPLTDTQQMALLGEAIGKYITVNATVINSMNGRVLSREIQRVQNENNFALNR